MNDLIFLSAVAMAEQVRARKISPVELVDAHLAQIEKLNPKLNAFVEIDPDRARRSARDAETAVMRGASLGPLHGVPCSVKSSISVAGLRCEAGSRLRAGFVAREDAPLVQRMKNTGAIILGTTNTPELLMAWETDNLLYGRTNNPWDLERTPGGSSGGEAAAIAAGMSAGGVGSDGGGSIRVPALFSGICGLKPTPGRIPSTGHFPISAGPFAQIGVVGPMARTIADLKILFEVMQGPDVGDSYAAPVAAKSPNGDEVTKLKIAFFEDDSRTPVTPETRAAVRTAAQALSSAGFRVEHFRPPGSRRSARALAQVFRGCRRDAPSSDVQRSRVRHEPDHEGFSSACGGRTGVRRRRGAQCLDPTRFAAGALLHRDAELSDFIVSGCGNSGVQAWRASLARGR